MADQRLRDAHVEVCGACAQRVQHGSHGTRVRVAARSHRGRLLRNEDAAEAAGDDRCTRGAHVDDPALRSRLDPHDREGDPGVGPGAHPVERREDDPVADPAAHRGAP